VLPLIDAAFRRTKITFFAYGQTGSGKTYTMLGDSNREDGIKLPGLYILAADEIFRYLERVKLKRRG
jgi:kinesin family member 2/24